MSSTLHTPPTRSVRPPGPTTQASPSPAVDTPARRVVSTGAAPRMIALTIIRVAMVAITGLSAWVDPALDGAAQVRLAAIVVVWTGVTIFAEASRRTSVGVNVVARWAYMVDGVLITGATLAAGGSGSPLFFLAFVHVIAVTLLASYLNGLKVALWDSLLLLMAAAAQTAGAVPWLAGGSGAQAAAAIIRAVALLAVTAATAGASALNERELRLSRAGLETMLGTGQALMAAERAEEAMQIALAALTGPLDFETAACVAAVDGTSPLIASRRSGVETTPVETDRDVQPPHLQAPLLKGDPTDLGDPLLAELLDHRPNAIAVPLRGAQMHGVLAASLGGRPRRQGLPVRRLELIESLSAQLSQTLERIALSDAIARAAMQDGLTGVPNRRHFDEEFERLATRAAATGQPLSVLAIDIDHFKPVNDVHGHQVGDEVLKVVASVLDSVRRRDDVIARYGGEEFALLLPATDLHGAVPVAERLRRAVAEAATPVPVTVSVGVACSSDAGLLTGPLFAAADQALYQAKGDGRNCVRVGDQARVA